MKTKEKIKKHPGREDLLGEHKAGDTGQIILFLLFLTIWIGDSFIYKYSTFLHSFVPLYIRISMAGMILLPSLYLAITGHNKVFGVVRKEPTIITEGIYSKIRHPLYTSAVLLYLGLIVLTMSLLSAGFWLIIVCFYYFISRYEEKILIQYFGDAYRNYKKEVGMWFPKVIK